MGCFAEVVLKILRILFCDNDLSSLSMNIPFHSMSTDLSIPYLQHHASIISTRSKIIVDSTFFNYMLLVSLHLRLLVNNILILLSRIIRQSQSLYFGYLCLQNLRSYMKKQCFFEEWI